jgi:nucleotidyltransferase substrate binding protein (TIGR01987 family)
MFMQESVLLMSNELDLKSLKNCIESLASAKNLLGQVQWFESLSDELQSLMISGAVKNFEFVYELSVKFIKRSIELSSLDPTEIDHLDFKEILRVSFEKGIISSPEPWFTFRKLRNTTAHTYDSDKAHLVSDRIEDLLEQAQFLLRQLIIRHGT